MEKKASAGLARQERNEEWKRRKGRRRKGSEKQSEAGEDRKDGEMNAQTRRNFQKSIKTFRHSDIKS